MNDIKVLLLDLLEPAVWFEQRCEEMLLPAPLGLYLPNSTQPKILPDTPYYDAQAQLLTSPGYSEQDHFDVAGARVLTASQQRYLRSTPYLPVRGIDVLVSMVERQIQETRAYHQHTAGHPSSTFGYEFDKWLKPEYRYEYVIEAIDGQRTQVQNPQHNLEAYQYLQNVLDSFIRQITSFIDDDGWMLYDLSVVGTSLTLTKRIDYRVDFYNRMHIPGQLTLAIAGGSAEVQDRVAATALNLVTQIDPEISVEVMVCGKK